MKEVMSLPKTFKDMPLNLELQRAIENRGYVTPTEIQQKAIPILSCEDIDFLGQAQTGTGKTAAFVIPILNRVDPSIKSVQAIILTPTRELANQICQEMEKFCPETDYRTLAVYGGVSIVNQMRDLKKDKPQVVVATPGRALDLINRGVLKLNSVKIAVLDEADVMLDMGFTEDVMSILDEVDEGRNIWLFSATMPPAIRKLVDNYLKNPVNIKIQGKTLSAEGIDQKYFVVRRADMLEALCRLLMIQEDFFGIVFCKMKIDAKEVSDALNQRGIPADALHGDLSQMQRDATMKNFKDKKIKLLVCTDVAARGIDIDNLTHVVNYSLPQELESYVHRIGRTGRAGAKGVAWSFVEPRDTYKLRAIERLVNIKLKEGVVPTAADVRKKMMEKDLARFEEISKSAIPVKLSDEFKAFCNYFKNKELDEALKILFSVVYSEKLDQFLGQGDVKVHEASKLNKTGAKIGDREMSGVSRLFMNMGKDHGLALKSLLKAVSVHLEVDERQIQRVDMKATFSFMEVPSKAAQRVLGAPNLKIMGRAVRYELSSGATPTRTRRN